MGHRHHRPGEDLISGLPDDLLHVILLRLGSIRAAARTSLLSRRWSRVWTQLPEIFLLGDEDPRPAVFVDSVDMALAAHSAPTVEILRISLPNNGPGVPACRVASWLRFASQRVVGTLSVNVPEVDGEEEELEIPACRRATRINLMLDEIWRLRLPPAGLFAALTELNIRWVRVEGAELTALVSTQCPRLKRLCLAVVTLCTISGVSIRSDSLESLYFNVCNSSRLEITAPRLEDLNVYDAMEVQISAPKLAKLEWGGGIYDPCRHDFGGVRRHLQLLKIRRSSMVAALLKSFDTVDNLSLDIFIRQDIYGYKRFLNETSKLPKCETLLVSILTDHHGLVPIMLHLLRNCGTARKISVELYGYGVPHLKYSCPSSCPCRLPQNRTADDDIVLGSLEEVEISCYSRSSQEEVEFMEQLSRCNATNLKKIVMYHRRCPAPVTKEVWEKVRSSSRPNLKVEFFVLDSDMRWVPFHRAFKGI